jgi:hypothetical protein
MATAQFTSIFHLKAWIVNDQRGLGIFAVCGSIRHRVVGDKFQPIHEFCNMPTKVMGMSVKGSNQGSGECEIESDNTTFMKKAANPS